MKSKKIILSIIFSMLGGLEAAQPGLPSPKNPADLALKAQLTVKACANLNQGSAQTTVTIEGREAYFHVRKVLMPDGTWKFVVSHIFNHSPRRGKRNFDDIDKPRGDVVSSYDKKPQVPRQASHWYVVNPQTGEVPTFTEGKFSFPLQFFADQYLLRALPNQQTQNFEYQEVGTMDKSEEEMGSNLSNNIQ